MRGYRTVDYLTQGYVILVGLIIVFFHGERLPLWPLYAAGHVACVLACHALIGLDRRHKRRLLGMLRSFYPMILYTALYCETHLLDRFFCHTVQDGFVIDLDQWIFGSQLCRTLMQTFPSVWVSELFYLSYFSYYVMIFGVGLVLYFQHRRAFFHYLAIVSLVFYFCYLTYIFLPVMGPHGTKIGVVFRGVTASVGPPVIPEAIRAGPFFNLMKFVYKLVEPEGGAAFPSSHVAVAMVTVWFTWTHLKRIRWLHLVAVIMLCLSTVYCGYHYAVDVLAGIATAAALVPIGHLIYRRWEGRGVKDAGDE